MPNAREKAIKALEALVENLTFPMEAVSGVDDPDIRRACGELFFDIIAKIDRELIPKLRSSAN